VCVAFEQASVHLCQPVCVCLESDNEQTGIRVYYEYYPGRWPNSVPMISALVVNIQLTPTWDFLFLRPTRVASEHGLALHGMAWHGGGGSMDTARPGKRNGWKQLPPFFCFSPLLVRTPWRAGWCGGPTTRGGCG
jgi:hypothetical protein